MSDDIISSPTLNPGTLNTGFRTKLPHYFFDLTHPVRWTDPYASQDSDYERLVLSTMEIFDKARRNKEYTKWLEKFGIKPRQMLFQRIRIINDKYHDSTPQDWWPKYHAAIFTVFMNPVTLKNGKKWIQYYVLCPEDCELICRHEAKEKGTTLRQRKLPKERFVFNDKAMRCFVVPTSCCHHLRNETVAGALAFKDQL